MTNRKKSIQYINSVLKNSKVSIFVTPKGFVKKLDSGMKWNVRISLGDKLFSLFYKGSEPDDMDILSALAYFLKRPEVKKLVVSDVQEPCTCGKCNGTGYLEQFAYYAEGVCFDCLGAGIIGLLRVKVKRSPTTPREICKQYYVSGSYGYTFPENLRTVKAYGASQGHPTAHEELSEDEDFYYVHAPVCKRNSWYKIPKAEFDVFDKNYMSLISLKKF